MKIQKTSLFVLSAVFLFQVPCPLRLLPQYPNPFGKLYVSELPQVLMIYRSRFP